jgi:hypothetical protein
VYAKEPLKDFGQAKDDWSSDAANADHHMEQGKKAAERKDWTSALWSFSQARKYYDIAKMPKAHREANRWIVLCESKVKDV